MKIELHHYTPAQQAEIAKILDLDFGETLEQKLSDSVNCCPHCKSKQFQKYGKVKGKQRYRCNSCKKTFGNTNNTPFFRTQKDLDQWQEYIETMFDTPMAVRKIAPKVEIHYRTAFFWRHKVLNALSKVKCNSKLAGIVEADETYFALSFKGQRRPLPRPARKRGKQVTKRGLSKQQVCVMTAMDRSNDRFKTMLLQTTCLATPTAAQVANVLHPRISAHNAVLVTDRRQAYGAYTRQAGLAHVLVQRASTTNGPFHVQNINSVHSNLKGFMKTFKGVATKYLDNYLAYYKWDKTDALSAVAASTSSVSGDQLTRMRMTLK